MNPKTTARIFRAKTQALLGGIIARQREKRRGPPLRAHLFAGVRADTRMREGTGRPPHCILHPRRPPCASSGIGQPVCMCNDRGRSAQAQGRR